MKGVNEKFAFGCMQLQRSNRRVSTACCFSCCNHQCIQQANLHNRQVHLKSAWAHYHGVYCEISQEEFLTKKRWELCLSQVNVRNPLIHKKRRIVHSCDSTDDSPQPEIKIETFKPPVSYVILIFGPLPIAVTSQKFASLKG